MIGPGQAPPGRGSTKIITVPAPALGADWQVTVPTGTVWYINSILCVLTTDTTVATRRFSIACSEAGVVYFRVSQGTTQPASITRTHIFGATTFPATWPLADSVIAQWWPFGYPVRGDHIIAADTVSLQAGDQYSTIRLNVTEAMEG